MSVWFSYSAIQLYCKNFCSTYCAPSGKIISNHKSNDSCHPSLLLRGGGVSCRHGLKMEQEDYTEECEEFHYVPLYWMSPCFYLTYILSISVQSQHMFELAVVTMIPYSLILNAVSA